ncbi:MAG TPA: DUF11 domain-containing protein [Gemmataceae bacterium]|nr:DUF11 domain-containing protein [Gemmataceae bacterium]
MNLKLLAAALLTAATLPYGTCAQIAPPTYAHVPAAPHLAPLLYARFDGAPGTQATFYQGEAAGKEFPAPVTVGLRPGYVYRAELRLPDHPGVILYPTLEVRGSLVLPPNMRSMDYPVPVNFSAEDVERALRGALLTKVIYLEPPDRALPVATQPAAPLETEIRPGQDIIAMARAAGRLMLIVRLGSRAVDHEELVHAAVRGTLMLPGDKTLGQPGAPPYTPWKCVPLYDPIAGPACNVDECLQDGGDSGPRVGLDKAGRLNGLDPSDTVAVYSDNHGGKHIAISNRVCICVPRFAVLSTLTLPIGYGSSLAVGGTQTVVAKQVLAARQPSVEAKQNVQLEALAGRQRPSGIQSQEGLVDVVQVEGLVRVTGHLQEKTVVGTLAEKVPPPERPLVLCKSVDKQAAHIGDVVTFTLRYTNQGGQPINDVVVSDSLTGRLEYIAGSAKSDRQAVFTMQENQAGSLILRWEVGGPLLPGQTGAVTFQARIR